ncbi:F0F1 ATP synthase subunit delta [Pseudidiomarina aestuarii]|uniref:ATP synthase subunit delta n=1 Tax=Pseudidiomarina aestuarii TaxID=624146 RepID=A0A2T4D0S6_9GAMM|nr:F0F1 ATP synthase subunit delta [Pseudidiomarina aestuarii]PTB87411.1 F0F1 ATP synthase subunit delta [Pseudidiomarina aestuarii]PTB89493.1 F0F1 ATP synthase subunit delta [Pseudidiomarina aestuarii]PTB90454.1 F0F1 ATP synthase subunit delta [Pseudidiomarina aestuarii]
MSELTTVARPYAKAAFDFAVENGALEKWNDMIAFAAAVATDATMATFLSSAETLEKKTDVYVQVCGEQLDENGQNFVRLMAENGRLKALPAVLALFGELRADYEKEVVVDVTSATKLLKKQQDELVKALEKRFSRKVKLNCTVDDNIVGGLYIKAGDTVIDGTVRGKIDRLAHALQS